MKEALRPPSGSPIIGGWGGLLGFLYSFRGFSPCFCCIHRKLFYDPSRRYACAEYAD